MDLFLETDSLSAIIAVIQTIALRVVAGMCPLVNK